LPEQVYTVREALVSFHEDRRVLRAFATQEAVYVQRYVILDGGITRANIEYELQEFARQIGHFRAHMQNTAGLSYNGP
jgi:hypothetical protein